MQIRVLHVLPHRGGGAESYIDMLERMVGVEHERAYLSSGRTPGSAAISLPRRYPRLFLRLRQADLVHVHGDAASIIGLPLITAGTSVVTTHGLHLLRRATGAAGAAVAMAIRAVAASSEAIICTSSAERDELLPYFGSRHRGKLEVIYNAVDMPPSQSHDRELVRAELGVGSEQVLGLFAGELEERKRVLLAASAASALHDRGAPFVLAVAGAGPQAAELDALRGSAIRPLGYRKDLSRLLAAADVFIAPADREGMSLALLEAMAHGLAVVASDGSGNPETIGDCGLIFPAGDGGALVAALDRVVSDPELRKRLGRQAEARAATEFAPARFLAQTQRVYERACAARSRPSPRHGRVSR